MIRGIILASLLLLSGQYNPAGPVFPHGTAPLNPCLVSAWPMNEGSGLTLHDTSSGGTNTATISASAAVTWQSNVGLPGTTPLWNGSGNGLATSTTLTNFTNTTPFAVSVWAQPNTSPALVGTLNTGSAFRGWELSVDGLGHLSFFLVNSYSGNALEIHGTAVITGAVHYLAVTTDGTGTSAGSNFYVDGVLDGHSTTHDSLTATAANGLPARFGARNDGSAELSGPMAFVEIYNCVPATTFWSTNFAAGPGIY